MLNLRMALSARTVLPLLALLLAALPTHAQTGILFNGAGPVNRSMGGAAVAAPIDASGALFYNPATISALPSSSMDFGVELLYPKTRISSSLPANAFGPGIPSSPLSGSDTGDNGIFAIPTMALVYKPDDSQYTYGLGIFTLGGFGTNYPASTTNPILTAQPPQGFGAGAIYSNLQVLQMTPTVSMQVTDRLSIGGGPTVTLADLRADPLLIAPPNPNGTYAPGTHSRMVWGGGFQVGAYYMLDGGWQLGASYKSNQWMESIPFQTVDNLGRPRSANFTFNIPSVTSIGVGYTGIERWTFATDLRYVSYDNTDGFRQSGFAANGQLQGLGWRSVFALAVGAQYQATDAVSMRLGYSYNQNPIADAQTSFNIASPTILEHAIYIGMSYQVTQDLSMSMAYAHCFQNSITGPLITPAGAVPGSSITSAASVDTFMMGMSVKFGRKACAE